ncbi:rab effector Noc2-like isoform X4 [Hypanus sabinus]|uniref:rab effector Noc2-like isoform X4 n=1 Tax=Hypanus sabinus TaxID=79690 RepID=UPI0028C4FB17|nr:rab effector Noc2-like isoform X4 [Hypanus sabinus]
MADTIFGSGTDQWVCPNDRQLALRAKLKTGWSVHTNETAKQRQNHTLAEHEIAVILEVIKRAENLDVIEQRRIGRLVERLENMKKNVMGNGHSQCLLCGELLGFLGSKSVFCQDCRRIWKRSGAWFYKGLPKYILPSKSSVRNTELHFRPLQLETLQHGGSVTVNRSYSWARGRVVSSDSESESECSSSSQDDKVSAGSSTNYKGRKQNGSGSRHLAKSSSGSQSNLGTERGRGSPATENLGDNAKNNFGKNSRDQYMEGFLKLLKPLMLHIHE